MREPAEMLRGAGLRSTAPRRAVLAELMRSPHATAPQLAASLASTDGSAVSHQGLYNVLDDLAAAGLVRAIEPAGSPARYELRVGDNHHHLVCRGCGLVADVDCAVGEAPCLDPARAPGFAAIDEAEVIWWGWCDACAGASTGPAISTGGAEAEPPGPAAS